MPAVDGSEEWFNVKNTTGTHIKYSDCFFFSSAIRKLHGHTLGDLQQYVASQPRVRPESSRIAFRPN